MTVFLADPDVTLHHGDVLETLRGMPDGSVDCVITSPPYWGLRDYGTGSWEGGDPDCDHATGRNARNDGNRNGEDGFAVNRNLEGHANMGALLYRDVCGKCGATRQDQQLGLEATPDLFVTRMVDVFREVRRVLAAHGTCWVNLGDSYATGQASDSRSAEERSARSTLGPKRDGLGGGNAAHVARSFEPRKLQPGLKPKDLVGIPHRVAFALQADGWYLRSDIIWAKPNPMPESVTDRPTKAHEYVFLLTKQPRYWFDQEAVREPAEYGRRTWSDPEAVLAAATMGNDSRPHHGVRVKASVTGSDPSVGRNIRSVWEIDYTEQERCQSIGSIGFCRECGGLMVVGSGSAPMTALATDVSSATTASVERTESLTSITSAQSRTASSSTISAETLDASTPDTSKQSPSRSTSTEETPQHEGIRPRPTVPTDTNTLLRTLTSVLMEAGIAASVCGCGRNASALSSVWPVATQPYPEAHFATYPEELVRRCVLAGCPEWVCDAIVCGKCGQSHPDITNRHVTAYAHDEAVPLPDAVQAELRRVRELLRESESVHLLAAVPGDQGDGGAGHEAEGRADQPSGLHPSVDADAPGCDGEGLHPRTPLRDGAEDRATAGTVGEGASQERDQGRQPPVELGDRDGSDSPWRGRVSELRDALLRSLTCGCGATGFRVCGKPRERIVEKALVATRGKVGEHGGEGRADPQDAGSSYQWNGGVYGHYDVSTVGWSDCGHNNYRPGVVLDPFIGSGTTAHVARKHGRHAIGIDLNADYLALAARRLQQQSLFADVAP